ncbi:MAG: alpha/beta fold hydrolase, partial [Acidobacteria bacterium]|nr:alpha/beta fold hydrolase [Acidobacteriota bacterium]
MQLVARVSLVVVLASRLVATQGQPTASEGEVLRLLQQERPYHAVSSTVFDQLGWPLPDAGAAVKALADAAPGGAFDPRRLEAIPAQQLGYRASWREVRYRVYGLDWDISALHLTPNQPVAGLPTVVIINGGSANFYEFFVTPLNEPGLGQYLAQRVPVVLITIPGNYRHGGWTEKQFEKRIPGYLLDRDVSAEEAKIRHSVYTFRVVTDGVKKLIEAHTTGPVVVVGHSTGGEVQFMLKDSSLKDRLRGLSFGWGTGGPAALSTMREFRGERTADDYPAIWDLNPRPPSAYARGYLGPLNPVWDARQTRLEVATRWMGLEETRRPQFKQTLQNIEHNSADGLRDHVASQIRNVLKGNPYRIDPEEVIGDLFTTMRPTVSGYTKMIWTVAKLDDGHWNPDPAKAREVQVADQFRKANPGVPIRVLLFDVPMTHYGHIEKPRELAGGLVA